MKKLIVTFIAISTVANTYTGFSGTRSERQLPKSEPVKAPVIKKADTTSGGKIDAKTHLKDPATTFTAAWMMWDEYKTLSEEERKGFVEAATNRVAAVKDSTIVFEGFYAGMPLIDFIALSEDKKIFQKWEKMFSGSSRWHYAEVSGAKDLASRYIVTLMIFEGKDWCKLLPYDDDEAFDQFLHKYVLKKAGKPSPLTVLTKTKWSKPDAYDRRWQTYTSTRMGVAAGWCKDESFLKIEKLGEE